MTLTMNGYDDHNDDYSANLGLAATGLEDATDSLAGAYAALKHAGRDDLAESLVGPLTDIRGVRRLVGDGPAVVRVVGGTDPRDWWMDN